MESHGATTVAPFLFFEEVAVAPLEKTVASPSEKKEMPGGDVYKLGGWVS